MAEVVIKTTTAGLKDGNYAAIGKLATPLKMYIQNESNAAAKKQGPAEWLMNITKSDRFAESGVAEARNAGLSIVAEGAEAPNYGRNETDLSTIYMYQFMRNEIITATDVEDAYGKVSGSMQRQMRRMVNDYYVTRNNLAAFLMSNGTKTSATFGGATLPIGAPNNNPLFFNKHPIGGGEDTQSNILYGQRSSAAAIDKETIEAAMNAAAVHMMGLKTNDGQALGYYPDIMVIPGNNAALIKAAKQAIGSEYTDNGSGAASNGINIQHGNWSLVILPQWQLTDPTAAPMIFMSSAARDNMGGNMLYDRTPYKIHDWIDGKTMNYCWTGRARMGIGHHTYKHAVLFESLASGVTKLYDGQTAADAATLIKL